MNKSVETMDSKTFDALKSNESNNYTQFDTLQFPNQDFTSLNLPSDCYYNMGSKRRGRAYIFNHHYFLPELKLSPRDGTDIDCECLKDTLEKFRFKVSIFKDLTYDEIKQRINKLSKKEYSYNCLALIILTHGENNQLYAKDTVYEANFLWKSFSGNLSLLNKPKIFFIQACQGCLKDIGFQFPATESSLMEDRLPHVLDNDLNSVSTYEFFNVPDFLIVYSTVPNYVSWRNKASGAWFIQILADCLRSHGTEFDLLTLLTYANKKLAIDLNIHNKYKQVMRVHSSLTRLIQFKKDKTECSIL